VDEAMATEIIRRAWKDLTKHFDTMPLPLLKLTRRLRKGWAKYKPNKNTIYISINHIEEVLKEYGADVAYCEAKSILAHELRHFIDINKYFIYDDEELERNAEHEELNEFRKCLEERNIII
jgi:hypothetical protein